MKKRLYILLFAIALCLSFSPYLQADTIRQMQYNLLYYTNNGVEACNETTNNLDAKDNNLKKIIKYVQPDVLTVNEIGKENQYADRILNNVLNTDGVTYYAYCPAVSNSSSYITIGNRLFYDTRKLALKSSFYVSTSVTYFNAYKMYYLSDQLIEGDTAYITFIVCHLKAGSYDDNITARNTQVQSLMNRLASIGIADNYVLSGDFNLYTSTEPAYQLLIHNNNSLIRFNDPLDEEGEWGGNYSYRHLHTQSTHNDNAECFSGGGMDSRFDFILVSNSINNNLLGVQSLNDTYHALGQDGNRFNGSIISPTNHSIPSDIPLALFNMSDHLPVIMDYAINATTSIHELTTSNFAATAVNPIENQLQLWLQLQHNDRLSFEVYSIEGRLLHQEMRAIDGGDSQIQMDFPFPPACYLVRISDSKRNQIVKKIIKL